GLLQVRNRPPGEPFEFPAKDVVDAGFLELVRYGIRRFDDPLIEDSLRVVDAVLKVNTPLGPCWHRYNHDGYGQRENGGPYEGWGRVGPGRCPPGSGAIMKLARGATPDRSSKRSRGLPAPRGSWPGRGGTGPIRPKNFLTLGGPPG